MLEHAPGTTLNSPQHREASPARMIQILQCTTDFVAMMDRDMRITFINKSGLEMLGLDELRGDSTMKLEDVFTPWAYLILSAGAIAASREHGSWTGETAIATRDGREIPVSQVLLAHSDGKNGIEFYSTICRDISERKQRELEQIEWSNRYDAAVRASGQVMFDWDSTTGQIDYGGAIERLTGYRFNELTGGMAQLKSLIHAEDRMRFDACIDTAISTRESVKTEVRLSRRDGREIVAKIEGHFFLDRLGRIGRMVGFLSDITAERMYERSIQLTHERLEHSVAERTRELERANAELLDIARQQEAVARFGQRAIIGIDAAELISESVEILRSGLRVDFASVNEWVAGSQLFHCRASAGWPQGAEFSDTATTANSQSGYTISAGTPVTSHDYLSETRFPASPACTAAGVRSAITAPIHAGAEPFGVIGAFSASRRHFGPEDVSFIQGIASILSAALDRLRTEESARRAHAEAEAANRAKSDFLSRMSHELRTPLNAILGFTQLLELEQHNERQAESIDHISRAGRNLLALINEVLDIARIDSGRIALQPEPVELIPLLEGVIAQAREVATSRQVSLHLIHDDPRTPIATTDRERFRQVMAHIVENAIHYNHAGGKVTVTIAMTGTDYWKVSIADTGEGIPAELVSRLFVPFERLGQKEGGTAAGAGLGLALCQRLVKALDGRIGMSSSVGLGSTFWVEIPALVSVNVVESPVLEETPAATPGPTAEPAAQAALRTILYIEDDFANFHLLQRILETRKNVKLASMMQGSGALEAAIEQQPALILLDLNLPDMSGESLLQKLKSTPETSSIPVIIVTGDVMGDRAEKIIAQGAEAVMEKPYRVQDLLKLIDRYAPR
ncbi:MAG: hypothetical protein RL088_1541 [Verrucomicrobiota bacterium]|jgi:PAS domain S-box-containing protein